MAQNLSNKYYVRKSTSNAWEDVTTKFSGVKILSIDGFNEVGEAQNVYTAQWVNSQAEDLYVLGNSIVRSNVNLTVTFIVGNKYGTENTQATYNNFVKYMCDNGDFYIKSRYVGKEVHVICLKGNKITSQKLHRGVVGTYIIGTIELHMLDIPSVSPDVKLGDLYIGFGGETISNPQTLANVQHYNVMSAEGDYTIVCPSTSYLWICFVGTINRVSHAGFEIPMMGRISVGNLWCYRSANSITPHTMSFSII